MTIYNLLKEFGNNAAPSLFILVLSYILHTNTITRPCTVCSFYISGGSRNSKIFTNYTDKSVSNFPNNGPKFNGGRTSSY